MTFSAQEYRWRFDRTFGWLEAHQLDALVVYSYKSALTAYWTGYSPRSSVTNVSIFAVESTGRSVHITRHPLHLATASSAMPDLEQICPSSDSTAVSTPEEMAAALGRWLPEQAPRVGFAAYAPEAGMENLIGEAVPGVLINLTSSVWSLIATRSTEQLERLREASAVARAAFEAGLSFIRPGEPLQPAAVAAEAEMRRLGNIVQCFVGATDKEGRTVLHPRKELLTRGSIVTFEVIPECNLFCPEVISTVYVGEVPKAILPFDVGVRQCLNDVIGSLSSASSAADVAKANADALVNVGLPPDAAIRIGHGTGLDNIEQPEDFRLSDKDTFGPNRVISIHPNAVVPGTGTVVRGGTVILTEDRCEPLFEFPSDPILAV